MSTFQKNLKQYSSLAFITLAVLLVLFFFSTQVTFGGILNDLLIGLISALILLILVERREMQRDIHNYGYLAGKYKRLERYNEMKSDSDTLWKQVNIEKDNPDIKMIYIGNREYEIPSIHYDEKWVAKANIFLDASNNKIGTGVYHYTKKADSIREDFGKFELFVDSIDPKKIYLFHQNYVPSGLSRGYEIFIKQ